MHVTSKPAGVAALGLRKESFDLDKVYAGLSINLGLVDPALVTDKIAAAASYSAKFGFRF